MHANYILVFGCVIILLVTSFLVPFPSLMKTSAAMLVIHQDAVPTGVLQGKQQSIGKNRCALLFFGLPRSYETIVLPSIVQNVLKPNRHCDVYAHAVMRAVEGTGRSGSGGMIDPNALHLLRDKVHELHSKGTPSMSDVPHVAISTDTEDDFWRMHNATIHEIRTTKAPNGTLLYFPWKCNFNNETVDNIVRQWHSIQSVWELMEKEAEKLGVTYTRVGMFRSDVFFATPVAIDIDGYNNKSSIAMTEANRIQEAVYPGFALHPVNDRMFYGNYNAVKFWATQRFNLLVRDIGKMIPGTGLHPERFLDRILFPAIRANGTQVTADPDICFFRVRADNSVWINDCLQGRTKFSLNKTFDSMVIAEQQRLVEATVGRKCELSRFSKYFLQVKCPNDTVAVSTKAAS